MTMYSDRNNLEPVFDNFASWRVYQDRLKRSHAMKTGLHQTGKVLMLFAGLVLIGYGIFITGMKLTDVFSSAEPMESEMFPVEIHEPQPEKAMLDKQNVRSILTHFSLDKLSREPRLVQAGDQQYQVFPSIDVDLQDYITQNLDTRHSRYLGIVVTDPETGRILSMAYLDKTDPGNNPCVSNAFPAASIFKIITAAAGIESKNFSADRKFGFNGGSHTLYKTQINGKTNKASNWMTLKDAFAKSVNPVFGKIGANDLGKTVLEDYAQAFCFNQPIEFEMTLQPSEIKITDDTFQWAEVASGFNKSTVITPVHGALIAGAIINGGVLLEPTIVDKILDDHGRLVYEGRKSEIKRVISPQSAGTLQQLMNATVVSGTGRRSFNGYRKDKILSQLTIGGKTGSIDNITHDVRFDWFVGYAHDQKKTEKIAVSILVAHDKFIGTKSGQYAKLIMKYYFERFFGEREKSDGTKL